MFTCRRMTTRIALLSCCVQYHLARSLCRCSWFVWLTSYSPKTLLNASSFEAPESVEQRGYIWRLSSNSKSDNPIYANFWKLHRRTLIAWSMALPGTFELLEFLRLTGFALKVFGVYSRASKRTKESLIGILVDVACCSTRTRRIPLGIWSIGSRSSSGRSWSRTGFISPRIAGFGSLRLKMEWGFLEVFQGYISWLKQTYDPYGQTATSENGWTKTSVGWNS